MFNVYRNYLIQRCEKFKVHDCIRNEMLEEYDVSDYRKYENIWEKYIRKYNVKLYYDPNNTNYYDSFGHRRYRTKSGLWL